MNFQHISTNLKVRLSKHLKSREVHLPISRKTSKDNLPTSFNKFEKSTFENFGKLLKVDLLNIFRKWEDKISPSAVYFIKGSFSVDFEFTNNISAQLKGVRGLSVSPTDSN